jgi:hypothetical protein
MAIKAKIIPKTSARYAKHSRKTRNPVPRVAMKAIKVPPQESPQSQLERQFQKLFTAFPMPSHGLYTESDSLEQPSAQKYVPSITVPTSVS